MGQLAIALQWVSSAITLGVQVGQTWAQLQPVIDMGKQLLNGKPLTTQQTLDLSSQCALWAQAALRPLGDKPVDAS